MTFVLTNSRRLAPVTANVQVPDALVAAFSTRPDSHAPLAPFQYLLSLFRLMTKLTLDGTSEPVVVLNDNRLRATLTPAAGITTTSWVEGVGEAPGVVVGVGVRVCVGVGVCVGTPVGVGVGVEVEVAVGLGVAVGVGVEVGPAEVKVTETVLLRPMAL
jgi:hypothetical protein